MKAWMKILGYLLIALGLSIALGIAELDKFIVYPAYWANELPLTINLNKLLACLFFIVAGACLTKQPFHLPAELIKPLLAIGCVSLLSIAFVIIIFKQTLLPSGIPTGTNTFLYLLLFSFANFLSACIPEQALQIVIMKAWGFDHKARVYMGLFFSSFILAALHFSGLSEIGTLALIMIAFIGYGATWLLTRSLIASATSHLLINIVMFFNIL